MNFDVSKLSVDVTQIPTGDMPGDKVQIMEGHIEKAKKIWPELLVQLEKAFKDNPYQRAVVSVHGGSGVGKSEIGSLLAFYLNTNQIGTYILSGDNYPHRIPKSNDEERLRIFREYGIKGLVKRGEYTKERHDIIKNLQLEDTDFDPNLSDRYPWLMAYQGSGREGLSGYLGSHQEIDFDEVSRLILAFKQGVKELTLKRMGREEQELWYDAVDMRQNKVLIIEWTHGNNPNLKGVDIPILLNSTPEETLAHRKSRNRDGGVDSPFTTMVLGIEQRMLHEQAFRAKIIVLKSGEVVDYEHYQRLMTGMAQGGRR